MCFLMQCDLILQHAVLYDTQICLCAHVCACLLLLLLKSDRTIIPPDCCPHWGATLDHNAGMGP